MSRLASLGIHKYYVLCLGDTIPVGLIVGVNVSVIIVIIIVDIIVVNAILRRRHSRSHRCYNYDTVFA